MPQKYNSDLPTIFSPTMQKRGDSIMPDHSDTNVSNPPTDAELDAIFGAASDFTDGFLGTVDDAGGGLKFWLCLAINGNWTYVELALAL